MRRGPCSSDKSRKLLHGLCDDKLGAGIGDRSVHMRLLVMMVRRWICRLWVRIIRVVPEMRRRAAKVPLRVFLILFLGRVATSFVIK